MDTELEARYQAKKLREAEIYQLESDRSDNLPESAGAGSLGDLMAKSNPGNKLAEIGKLLQRSSCNRDDELLAVALKYSLEGGEAGDEQMLRIQSQVLNSLFLHYTEQMLQARTPTELLEYQRVALKSQTLCVKTIQALKSPASTTVIKQANVANGPQQVNN